MALVIFLALLSHDEKVVSADLRVDGDRVQLRLHVGMERISKGVQLPAEPIELTELQLERAKADVAAYVLSRTTLTVDGAGPRLELVSLEPRFEKFLATGEEFIASVVATFQAPVRASTSIGFSYDAFVEYPGSKVLVTAAWGAGKRTYVRMGPDPLEIRGSDLDPTAWQTAGEFLLWGMHHIFIGFDHIAFLLALLLGASKVGEMVKIVTSFTVAHSLTLLLAATGVIRMNPRITEALIAASIVYVAAENYVLRNGGYRWILTFGFGLVHGLGFSEVLRERLGEVRSIALPVVSFNVGVEFGQLAILAVAFPLLAWIRRTEASRAWTLRIGSAAILL
ncbi:MAG TPA: HupE/UreJ family protein, partial [Planctomycetota bacterium]